MHVWVVEWRIPKYGLWSRWRPAEMHEKKIDAAQSIKVGDMVAVDPVWNGTTGYKGTRFTNPLQVRRITHAQSQTGVLLHVVSDGGNVVHMDAGWFSPVEAKS